MLKAVLGCITWLILLIIILPGMYLYYTYIHVPPQRDCDINALVLEELPPPLVTEYRSDISPIEGSSIGYLGVRGPYRSALRQFTYVGGSGYITQRVYRYRSARGAAAEYDGRIEQYAERGGYEEWKDLQYQSPLADEWWIGCGLEPHNDRWCTILARYEEYLVLVVMRAPPDGPITTEVLERIMASVDERMSACFPE